MGGSDSISAETQLLAAAGLNQPVDRVIGVVVAGLDPLIAEENDALNVGIVLNVSDVAHRIVGVREILHRLLIGGKAQSCGREANQTEGQRIVGISRPRLIAVRDQYPLTFCVVVDVRDERSCSRRAAQIHGHGFQQVRFVVSRAKDAAVWHCGRDPAIERVILRAAHEHVRQHRGQRYPVRQRLVIRQKLTRSAQQIPFEIVAFVLIRRGVVTCVGHDAGRVA